MRSEVVVPDDHQIRRIAAVLDLSWVRTELAPHYSHTGRPSIDLELMIRMLILGHVFAIRSERALCREVQVNLAYRWPASLCLPRERAIGRRRSLRGYEGSIDEGLRSPLAACSNCEGDDDVMRNGRAGSGKTLASRATSAQL